MEVETVKLTPAAKSSVSSSSDSIWTPTVRLTPATAKGLVLKEAPAYRQKDPFEEYDPWATSSKCDDNKPNDEPLGDDEAQVMVEGITPVDVGTCHSADHSVCSAFAASSQCLYTSLTRMARASSSIADL